MSQSNTPPPAQDPFAFLAGGGEMGRLIRSMDWSGTPLGPVESWPQSLRTTVNICLASDLPICIIWGPGLAQIYNDGYRVICGGKHPRSLGQNFSECWREAWPVIGKAHDSALAGDTVFLETQPIFLDRHGYTEECFFTFSFSPIRDEAGHVCGLFHPVIEMTAKMLGERRTRTLRDVAARTAKAKTVEEACTLATQALANHDRDVPFALLYLLDADGQTARLVASAGMSTDTAASPERVDIASPVPASWPLAEVARTGQAQLVDDMEERFSSLACGPYPEAPRNALALPLTLPGSERPVGVLITGVSGRLKLTQAYRDFIELMAATVTTAVANGRAFEEERRRAEALAELDRAKTAFFSNVSHEFRTPLTLMLGPVEDLLARSQTDLTPSATRQLEVVNRNGLRLLRLVNTLLDFSRIEAGRVRATYQPTDLAALTAELASVFRAAIERAGLRLIVDCPTLSEPVYVDREMWEKVVLNLLSNAFKFTFEGDISVTLRRGETAAELVVRDTGTGIPAEEMPRLFERFHRIENSRSRTHEGSGIGLALVHELIKLHGGSIAAESVVGKGTTFTLSVPLGSAHLPTDQIGGVRSPASTGTGAMPYVEETLRWLPDEVAFQSELPTCQEAFPVPHRPETDNRADDRPRVLVADDNADMRQYVVRLLAEHFRTEAVPDGEAALAAAREHTPDLILTDVMMPRLDGFGLLRALRADPRTSSVPVIMLSARAGEESRVEGLEAGADDYLVKPFSARELLARVTAHLQMARMRRESSETLRLSHARFEALFDATPIGVCLVDADLRIRQVNPTARPVFGDMEDLVGKDFVEVIHVLWPPKVAEDLVARFRHTLETGEPYRNREFIEQRHDTQAHEFYDWQIHRILLPEGQYGVVCYFIDISSHVLARQELADADRRKDEFLATLAHELRNPLAPIRNGLQIIRLAGVNGPIEQARMMMDRQLTQLIRLVDDLLDVSRISRGKFDLRTERVELKAVIDSAVETARPLIEQACHKLSVVLPDEPNFVVGDVTRLAQVVSNLLTNSAKYTLQGGHIRLTVEAADGMVAVSVKDDGIGIPPAMLGRVFEMFTQVDRTLEKTTGGLGIGLSLAKGLVELHGGTIEARSEGEGRGSEFVVRLPLAVSLAAELPDEGGSETIEQGDRRRILVVDDNRDSAKSLAMMLKLMGNELRTAHDGLEALDLAAAFRPDLILLDIGMPRLNGYDTARRIRERPWGKNTVLVALTGWGQEEDRRKSHEAGFDTHMVKPVDLAALKKLLANF